VIQNIELQTDHNVGSFPAPADGSKDGFRNVFSL